MDVQTDESYKGLFITDFDGTLLRSDRTLDPKDIETLQNLGKRNIARAIATGRSLYSFYRAADSTLPVDYVIFSTGAGILKFPHGEIFRKINLEPKAVRHAIKILIQLELDFMVHRPVPDNHEFAFWHSSHDNTDFFKRIDLYKEVCRPLDGNAGQFGPASQLLAILPKSRGTDMIGVLRRRFPALTIIRTTSPLDHESTWIELFSPEVSKSRAADWLAASLKIGPNRTLAVGNDYNDLDLLKWAGNRFVVANAPQDLKDDFPSVSSNNHCGVTEAVDRWLAAMNKSNR